MASHCSCPISRARQTAGAVRWTIFCKERISPRTEFSCPSNSTMRWARQPLKPLAAGAFAGGGKGEGIRDLERAGQKPGAKNGVNCPDGVLHRGEADRQAGAERGQGQELQGRFGDRPQQAFRTDEQAGEIEAGLVLVRAAAKPHHRAIGQHHFQTQHIVPGDTVFQDSAVRPRWWRCFRRWSNRRGWPDPADKTARAVRPPPAIAG